MSYETHLTGYTRLDVERLQSLLECRDAEISGLRHALAGLQEVINRSRRPWWRWLWEEFRVQLFSLRHGAAGVSKKRANG